MTVVALFLMRNLLAGGVPPSDYETAMSAYPSDA